MTDVRLLASPDLSPRDLAALRRLLDEAFAGSFSDDDWEHALGGWHAMVGESDVITAHASVVPRRLQIGARDVGAGYVEAVAVAPAVQRTGHGTAVMTRINDLIRAEFEIGALSTGQWPFYERLGWERWRGPSWVREHDGRLVRTADEDDGLMILRCVLTQDVDTATSITCEARPGECW